jgi:AAHS family 4-hydroxybenzoate transporter-like MFS transporter
MTTSTTLDIRKFLNERKMSPYLWILGILCFFIATLDGMDVAIMGFVAPDIIKEFDVSRPTFGVVMGAGPLGLLFGALLAGPLADYIGRRAVLLGAVFLTGVFCLWTGITTDIGSMSTLRIVTGFFLGAAMPNTITLMSEYVPDRIRSILIATMFTGFNFGSGVIGFIAAGLIPKFGWRSVLYFGGIVPLVITVFLVFLLPESARYMVARKHAVGRIRAVMQRVTGADLSMYDTFVSVEEKASGKVPMQVILSGPYIVRTLTLWVTYFGGLVCIYLTTSWLPTMMKDAGMSIERAASITAMFQIAGTFSAILVGWAMDRWHPNRIIGATYFLAGFCLVSLGLGGLLSPWVVFLVAAVGFALSGAQTGLNAFAPRCYPTIARSTGVGWMMGVGRLGSIFGSSIGGVLITQGWGSQGIFVALAVPACVAGLAILLNGYAMGQAKAAEGELMVIESRP